MKNKLLKNIIKCTAYICIIVQLVTTIYWSIQYSNNKNLISGSEQEIAKLGSNMRGENDQETDKKLCYLTYIAPSENKLNAVKSNLIVSVIAGIVLGTSVTAMTKGNKKAKR